MKNSLKCLLFIFLSVVIGIGGCGKDLSGSQELPEIIIPCDNLPGEDLREVIEIKDFQTKLYYQVPHPPGVRPDCASPPYGILYSTMQSVAALYYMGYIPGVLPLQDADPNSQGIFVHICNFPAYAVQWNPHGVLKRAVCISVEGELDVIISGIIHVSARQEVPYYYLSGDLELTSLKKFTPIKN